MLSCAELALRIRTHAFDVAFDTGLCRLMLAL